MELPIPPVPPATPAPFVLNWDKLLTALGPAAFQWMTRPPPPINLVPALGPMMPMTTRPIPRRPVAPFIDQILAR